MKYIVLILMFVATTFVATAQRIVDTTNCNSLYDAAKSCIEKSDYFTASRYLELASKIRESDTLKRKLAVCYFNRGYYKMCTRLCLEVLEPDTLESDLMLLTKSLAKSTKDIDSLLFFQKILFVKNPLNQSNTIAYAQTLLDNLGAKAAAECLQKYYEIDSSNLTINALRAKVFVVSEDYNTAISEFEKLIIAGNLHPINFYYLGVSYRKINDFENAVRNLEIANSLTPEPNPTILTQLGIAQLKIDSIAYKGSETLKQAVDAMQPNPQSLKAVYYNLASYYENRNWRKSLEYLLKIKDLDGMDASLSYKISICYQNLKNQPMEIEYLTKFLDLSDDSIACSYARRRIQHLRSEQFMNGDN
ncbi:MAG: hypothetical protein K6F33_11950 [Bacteroidales bacterium]|nr:hypothetical protein [Bacteroidales bacterium]